MIDDTVDSSSIVRIQLAVTVLWLRMMSLRVRLPIVLLRIQLAVMVL